MANGVSKNPSFRTDFNNINFIYVKSAPKKKFWGKTFSGCTFYKGQMYILYCIVYLLVNTQKSTKT